MLRISQTLAEKVLFRQVRHIGATRDRVPHSCFIARRVGRQGFSARGQLMSLLFEQIRRKTFMGTGETAESWWFEAHVS